VHLIGVHLTGILWGVYLMGVHLFTGVHLLQGGLVNDLCAKLANSPSPELALEFAPLIHPGSLPE